jgi:outer membrane receptor protein involved in Fe transport
MGVFFIGMNPMAGVCDRGLVPEEAKRQGFRIEIANLTNANLQGANLSSAMLPYVDLSNANLSNANLTSTILTCSKLNNVNLAGADLKDAKLMGAVLEGTDPKAAKNANLEGTFATAAAVTQAPIQNEAKQVVGSMNRAQQAYYLENERFAAQLTELGLGIRSDTEHYKYRIFNYPDRKRAVMLAGVPRRGGFKTYLGFVNIAKLPDSNELSTFAILCESVEAKPLLPKLPTSLPANGSMTCPEGFAVVGP